MSNSPLVLTRAQVREVDRIAIEKYGMPGALLMENAGANAARIILAHIERDARVAIVCGRGNNGGDGFVIARHLHNAGIGVEIFLACEAKSLTGDAALNCGIAAKMALPMMPFDSADDIAGSLPRLRGSGVIVDAILGTGFAGEVRNPLDEVIRAVNTVPATVFAIDLPSGLDCDTGQASRTTIRSDHTITFVALKPGLFVPAALPFVGRVHVVGIGCPAEIALRLGGALPKA